MTTDAPTKPDDASDPPAAPATITEIPYDTAQRSWISILTVLAGLAFVFSVVALVVAIAKDGGTTVVADAGGGAAGPGATELVVEGGEWFFTLDSPAIAAGTEVPVTFDNVGSIEHELVLLVEGARPADEANFSEDMVAQRLGPIPAGEVVEGTFPALDPATYLLICALPGHYNAGMAADLVVS